MKTLFTLVCLLSSLGVLKADTQITFTVTHKSERPKEKEIVNQERKYTLKLLLGEDFIEYSDEDETRIIDFARNRIFHSAAKDFGFRETSIYSDIGFRVYEFQNRMKLGGLLGEAKVEDNPMDRVLSEHLFSLRSKQKANLKRSEKLNHVVFSHNEKTLTSYSRDGSSVSKTEMSRFLIILRYRYGIHPDILDELGTEKNIPNSLIIARYNIGVDRFALTLKSVDRAATAAQRSEIKIEEPQSDKVVQIIAKMRGLGRDGFEKSCASLLRDATDHAKEKHYLESALLFQGYSLASGEQFPKELSEFRKKLASDKDVKRLFFSIKPQNKSTAEQATRDLTEIAEQASAGGNIALVFKASILSSLGRRNEAGQLYLKVLSANPFIVGAWKDLGDLYYGRYDSAHAWLCWDTARALNPEHPMLKPIDEFEKKLRQDHPDFFME